MQTPRIVMRLDLPLAGEPRDLEPEDAPTRADDLLLWNSGMTMRPRFPSLPRLVRFISRIGVILAIPFSSLGASGAFKPQAPAQYFADSRAITLLEAALAGDLTQAQRRVAEGADPNSEGPMKPADATRLRLLHYAIALGHQRAVQILIAVGADPELNAQHNGSAFAFATKLHKPEMLAYLLELRPVATLTASTVEDLIFDPVPHNCASCLEVALRSGVPIDTRNSVGSTVLMDALAAEDLEMVEWLLRVGASTAIEPQSGVTPAYQLERRMTRFTDVAKDYFLPYYKALSPDFSIGLKQPPAKPISSEITLLSG